MNQADQHIAVLTGDIVNSTALGEPDLESAIRALEKRTTDLAEWFGAPLNFSRHRGDGWQVALETPRLSLRTALILRATLRSLSKQFDTRIACATGTTSLPLDSNLNNETGPVFVRSGQLLQTITENKTTKSIRFANANGGTTHAAFVLADHISQDWTPAQAQAINFALEKQKKYSLTQIAENLGKSRQAVSKAIESAGYPALETALTYIEEKPNHD